jgi:hypothetical protein
MTPCQWIICSRLFVKTLISSSRTEKSKIRNVSLGYFEISAPKTLKYETNISSRKVGKELSSEGASHPTRSETSATPLSKPKNSRPAASYELYRKIRNICGQKMGYVPLSVFLTKRTVLSEFYITLSMYRLMIYKTFSFWWWIHSNRDNFLNVIIRTS